MNELHDRMSGCIAGLMSGDAIGAQVEFKSVAYIHHYFTNCRTHKKELFMRSGGTFNLEAGQVTDDSEMALSLIASFTHKGYNQYMAYLSYQNWIVDTNPFDCGKTIWNALVNNKSDKSSEANGALMRIAPLAMYYWNNEESLVLHAHEDCVITHPNKICVDCNILYCLGIAKLIQGMNPVEMYDYVLEYATTHDIEETVLNLLVTAKNQAPFDFIKNQGWVRIAFQNAFYQILHSTSVYEVIYRTVMNGGDTDTNAAISGAMAGAYYGMSSMPETWIRTLKKCKPSQKNECVNQPRPEFLWNREGFKFADSLSEPCEFDQ